LLKEKKQLKEEEIKNTGCWLHEQVCPVCQKKKIKTQK
jgi:hypothetical protein